MKIIAFLQNQHFHDPVRLNRHINRNPENGRETFIRYMLFMGRCLTGQQLMMTFGDDLCDQIIWEESSMDLLGTSTRKADPQHIAEVIRKHKPDLILTFGAVAHDGLKEAKRILGKLRNTPAMACSHPASRRKTVLADLKYSAELLRRKIEEAN